MGVCGLGTVSDFKHVDKKVVPQPKKGPTERVVSVPVLKIQTSALYMKRRSHSNLQSPGGFQVSRKTSEIETDRRSGSFCEDKLHPRRFAVD